MRNASLPSFSLAVALAQLGAALPLQAQFTVDNSKLPSGAGINSSSENVDFGDLDLDGDWDIAIADGGDDGNDQNRCWINQGGLQGGTLGQYADETAARFPVLNDDSRDVELADIDLDGDLDLYSANTAQISNQGARWWVNDGGEQGGTLAFFTDETSSRWVDLGGAGSSLPGSLLISGTFIDWSCDADFGDLDNDGDLDLVHSSYGGAFGGQTPTRMFLNDGDGYFAEFNPSGFQLTGSDIAPGDPGLWCDGLQTTNTVDTTGAQCDIASTALDIELGDIDGDFDLDLLHGAREELPRLFANRLEASGLAPDSGGALAFRDLTGGVFPGGYSTGNGHYEQEMQDLDHDGDLDLYGLNWQVGGFSFNDVTLSNDGSGVFGSTTVLAGSGADDHEGDFLDYDNDGDLDLFVANFSGQDKLYRNNTVVPGSFSFTQVSLPSYSATSLDADACDTDGDGDYDVVVAEDNFQANTFLRNTTETPDTTAPYLPNVEDVGARLASSEPVPVRVHVYDNAPYYITWYNDTDLEVTVDGVDLYTIPATSSAGQVFRAEVPGQLAGLVEYRFRSMDGYGNTGFSATVANVVSYGPPFQVPYGSGSAGLLGGLPLMRALSVPFPGCTLFLALSSGAIPGATTIQVIASAPAFSGILFPGLLTLHLAGSPLLVAGGTLDADGDHVLSLDLPPTVLPGTRLYAQGFVEDFTPSGEFFASSPGLELIVQ